jgi:multidrug efflux pump subunit AcrA (membrane-fusion protein)
MSTRRDRPSRPWLLYALGVVAIAVAALAVLEIGPPTSSARTSKETVTAEQGVIQSTVTGSGNIAAGTDVTVNFNTSGTLQDVYVHVGQHVNGGQLLADLDPTSANLQLSQAQSQLTAAEDQLTCLQNPTTANCGSSGSGGSGSGAGSGSSGSGSSGSGGSASTTSYSAPAQTVEYAAFHPPTTPSTSPTKPRSGGATTNSGTTTTKSGTKVTKTTPSVTVTVVVPSTTRSSPSSSGTSAKTTATATTTTTSTPSPSSLASAQASVYSAQAAVHSAEIAVNNTKLYAPTSGTIASLSSLTPGDTVSAGSSGSSSSNSSSSSSSSGSGAGAGGAATAGSLGGSGSSSSSGSSSGFAEIINTNSLTMTVAFSESDISKVAVGQPATVSLDALAGVQLAAHVSSISLVGTTSSSVVSYDATLTLDQNDSRVKPGMSASASVITGQASGVTVPNAAVTGSGSLGTVTLLKNGKDVTQQVVVGLRGASRTQIISGVNAGDQLVVTIALPSLSTSTSSSGSGTLGGGLGGLGGLGGGGGLFRGAGGGGGAFFRGGGGGG